MLFHMRELGYNPLDAILIALTGIAADMIMQYDRAAKMGEQLRKFFFLYDLSRGFINYLAS